MNTVRLNKEEVSYAPVVDVLYIVPEGGAIDVALEVEDLPEANISVYHSLDGGGFGGMEIYDFEKTYGKPPVTIEVPSRNPFTLEIPFSLS